MENYNLKQLVKKRDRSVPTVDPKAVKTSTLQRYADSLKTKPVAPQSTPTPVAQTTVGEAVETETQNAPPRGLFVGFDPSEKLFFKVVGNVKDTEYLSLVKYAEMQMALTLDLFNPVSNLKLMDMLKKTLASKDQEPATKTS